MLDKTDIATLIKSEDLYNQNSELQIFISKFALLELCGWLEQTMDDIIKLCANKYLKQEDNIKYVNDCIIGKTSGFKYENHFRPMLMYMVGFGYLESVEEEINCNGELDMLIGELSTLWGMRTRAAHTSISGATLTFHAPSVIKGHLNKIYPVLQKIEDLII